MKEENKPSAKTIYGIVMVLFYLFMGILVIFTTAFQEMVPNDLLRVVIGILFFLYGFFRGYRVWRGV